MTRPAGYEDLVTAATVGLDRRPLPLEQLAGPAGSHANVLDDGDPAAAFLDAAALLFSARRAGPVPDAAGTVTAAPPDTAPELSRAASRVLGAALRGSDRALTADLLTAAADAGFRAAAPMLPALLDAAVAHVSLRSAVCAVLGERGRWLTAYRDDWRRVAGASGRAAADDPAVWETGGRGQRHAWLAALRQRDPAAARELLAAGWARETGDDREELLGVLRAGLSGADEKFLESALDDRRTSVREVAAGLLAALPDSAFARRAVARGTATLQLGRQLLRPTLTVTLPASCDAAAARDGISGSRPSAEIGSRAWLLTQFIAAVPLAEWTARFGLDPAALAALPVAGGMRLDVHAGWRMAAVTQRDEAWATALLAVSENAIDGRPPQAWPGPAELAEVLPPAARVAHAQAVLAAQGPSPDSVAMLAGCAGTWPEGLADAVVSELGQAVQPSRRPRRVSMLIPVAARKLPISTGHRDYATSLRELAGAADAELGTRLRRAAGIIDHRRLFYQELL